MLKKILKVLDPEPPPDPEPRRAAPPSPPARAPRRDGGRASAASSQHLPQDRGQPQGHEHEAQRPGQQLGDPQQGLARRRARQALVRRPADPAGRQRRGHRTGDEELLPRMLFRFSAIRLM